MSATPKPLRGRMSLGEPCRVGPRLRDRSQSRDRSPGACSTGSLEDARGPSLSVSTLRPPPGSRGAQRARDSRDPRPVGDRHFSAQCARDVVDFLATRGYGKNINTEKFLKDPSTKEFFDIFRFLIGQLDPQFEFQGKMEDEVPVIMRRLKYPVEVIRSKLQAISGPNTWPQLLAVLDWIVVLIRVNEEYIRPVAECQVGLPEGAEPDHSDDGDHFVLGKMHENYMQYLGGRQDRSDEEQVRQIFEERIAAMRGEIGRLQEHQTNMEQRTQELNVEHERLQELQGAPRQLDHECDRLRAALQTTDATVQRLEEDTAAAHVLEPEKLSEIEGLEAKMRELKDRVAAQAYSKHDIERLKCERAHLRSVLADLRQDCEKAEQGVFDLGLEESRLSEATSRLVRRVNESVETAWCTVAATRGEGDVNSLRVEVDISEPIDALAAQDFTDLRTSVHLVVAAHGEAVQREEASLHEVVDEQRTTQAALSEKERECGRLKARREQLERMREEQSVWSAEQLDDAMRATEQSEDAVHGLSIGTMAPSLRDQAEIDELKLQLSALRGAHANEEVQLKEQIRRDEERQAEHQQLVMRELQNTLQSVEATRDEVLRELAKAPVVDAGTSKALSRGGG